MSIHDCGASLSRRMKKADRTWALELENTGASDLSELHIVEVSFRQDGEDGKPTVRIAFEDVLSLAPQERAVLKHTIYLFDEGSNAWVMANEFSDSLILLTEKSAHSPIALDAQFLMNGQNCFQELGAGQGSGLNLGPE